MKTTLKVVLRLCKSMSLVSEVTLTFMMLLTVSDVILRSFKRPIIGTYELVAFSGAVAIGFSVPITSWMRGHVSVDLFTSKLSQKAEKYLQYWDKVPGHRPIHSDSHGA